MPRRGRRGGGRGRGECGNIVLEPAIRSAQEIEDGISSKSTLTWNPFTVFPKEIYLEIFNKLEDPNDKERFMNAHPKWYDLFKSNRTLCLFEGVLKALAKNGDGIDPGAVSDSNGLTDKDYLNLQLVCRDWDVALQKYIQLHTCHFQARRTTAECIPVTLGYGQYSYINAEREWLLDKTFEWDSEAELKTSLEKIMVTHPPSRNPFLTRKIHLNTLFLTREGRAQVANLLNTYGHHIWHLRFHFCEKISRNSFSQFVKWLNLMPELITVHVSGELWFSEEESNYTKKRMREIDNVSVQLPEMRKLSVLKSRGLLPLVFNKLVSGIQGTLQTVLIANHDLHYFPLELYQLPVNASNVNVLVTGIRDFNHLKGFQALRKLTIITRGRSSLFPSPEWPDWAEIWRILEEAFPQLEELNLQLPDFVTDAEKIKAQEQSLSYRLNLMKLKKLKIELPHWASLDFILPLRGLEELQIDLDFVDWESPQSRRLERKEIIKFNMRFGKMWRSNIWQMLPKLKKLYINARTKSLGKKWFGMSSNCLYGYVKEGSHKRTIAFNPNSSFPHWEMYSLFFKSQSYTSLVYR